VYWNGYTISRKNYALQCCVMFLPLLIIPKGYALFTLRKLTIMFKYLLFKTIDLQNNFKILWEFVAFATINHEPIWTVQYFLVNDDAKLLRETKNLPWSNRQLFRSARLLCQLLRCRSRKFRRWSKQNKKQSITFYGLLTKTLGFSCQLN
jgi:hypothetical protein